MDERQPNSIWTRVDPLNLPFMGSPLLPFEIITAILRYNLPPTIGRVSVDSLDPSYEFLLSTSMVSSRFRMASQALLFACPIIDCEAEGDSLLAAITANKELGNTVRGIKIGGQTREWDAVWKIATILRACINAREVWLDEMTTRLEYIQVTANLRHLSLQHCSLSPQWHRAPPALFPRLVSLCLAHTSVSSYAALATFLSPKTLPALRYLSIDGANVCEGPQGINEVAFQRDNLTILVGESNSLEANDGIAGRLRSLSTPLTSATLISAHAFHSLLHLELHILSPPTRDQIVVLPSSIISLSLDFVYNDLPFGSLFHTFAVYVIEAFTSDHNAFQALVDSSRYSADRQTQLATLNSTRFLPHLRTIHLIGGEAMRGAFELDPLACELEQRCASRGIVIEMGALAPTSKELKADWSERRKEGFDFFARSRKVREEDGRRRMQER